MNRARGFTLLEMVIAVAMLAVVAAVAYASLNGMIRQHELATAHSTRTATLQRTMTLIAHDLLQVQPRAVREPFHGDREAAFLAAPERDGTVEWTRGGWANPAGHRRGTLQRVAWRLEDGALERLHWSVVDRGPMVEPVVTPLLEGVAGMDWRFLDHAGDWHDFWPPANDPDLHPDRLPRAVEFTLRLDDGDEFRRRFDLHAR